MRILDKCLSSSTCTTREALMLPVCPKLAKINIPIEVKEEDRLNIKNSTLLLDRNGYKEKDIFKEHLMSHIW